LYLQFIYIKVVFHQFTYASSFTATCQVNGNRVRTFDKVQYEIPPVECDTLVVGDCSPAERFMVTIAKAPAGDKKILKLFIDDLKVRIVPAGATMRVEVNGVTRPVSPKPVVIRQVPSDTRYVIASFLHVHIAVEKRIKRADNGTACTCMVENRSSYLKVI
jgi:hypothetical protein